MIELNYGVRTYLELAKACGRAYARVTYAMGGKEEFTRSVQSRLPLVLSDEAVVAVAAEYGWPDSFMQKPSKKARGAPPSRDVGNMLAGQGSQQQQPQQQQQNMLPAQPMMPPPAVAVAKVPPPAPASGQSATLPAAPVHSPVPIQAPPPQPVRSSAAEPAPKAVAVVKHAAPAPRVHMPVPKVFATPKANVRAEPPPTPSTSGPRRNLGDLLATAASESKSMAVRPPQTRDEVADEFEAELEALVDGEMVESEVDREEVRGALEGHHPKEVHGDEWEVREGEGGEVREGEGGEVREGEGGEVREHEGGEVREREGGEVREGEGGEVGEDEGRARDEIQERPFCAICQDYMHREQQLTALPCGHCWHTECLTGWAQVTGSANYQSKCPVNCHRRLPHLFFQGGQNPGGAAGSAAPIVRAFYPPPPANPEIDGASVDSDGWPDLM